MNELVSIVIPVYNGMKYLDRFVPMVLSQDYKPLEIIFVDDGSTDGSGEYLDKLEGVKVVHKSNGGCGSARNAGIEVVTGKYFCIADVDDTIFPTYVSKLVETLKDSDFALGSYRTLGIFSHLDMIHEKGVFKVADVIAHFDYVSSTWARLYVKEIIDSHNLRYRDDIFVAEDKAFNCEYLKYCKTVSFTDEIIYYYNCAQNTSLVHTYSERFAYSNCIFFGYFESLAKFLNADREIIEQTARRHFYEICDYYMIRNPKLADKCIRDSYEVFKDYLDFDDIEEFLPDFKRKNKVRCFMISIRMRIRNLLLKGLSHVR